MIVTAWNNGKHHSSGAGYGFKISIKDRDQQFNSHWTSVLITLPNGVEIDANINKDSFWSPKCHELINQQFGQWFIEQGFASWPKGRPPKFVLSHQSENKFRLEEI